MADSILMTMQGQLRFTKDGSWLHDGVPVTHGAIALFFSKRLQFSSAHGSYVVEDGGKCVRVEVEDTPRVVLTIDTTTDPWQLVLNSEAQEVFEAVRLRYSEGGELYYQLASLPYEARLLRSAVQAVSPGITERNQQFYFERGEISARLRPRNGS